MEQADASAHQILTDDVFVCRLALSDDPPALLHGSFRTAEAGDVHPCVSGANNLYNRIQFCSITPEFSLRVFIFVLILDLDLERKPYPRSAFAKCSSPKRSAVPCAYGVACH